MTEIEMGNILKARLGKLFFVLLVSNVIISFSSCEDEIILNAYNNPIKEETRIWDLNVTVYNIGSHRATINWDPVYNLNGTPFYYFVYLNGELVSRNSLTYDSLFTINNLYPETNYDGLIVATDSINYTDSAAFSFKTLKYFNRFDRVLETEFFFSIVGYSLKPLSNGEYLMFGTAKLSRTDSGVRGLYVGKYDSLGYEVWNNIIPTTGLPSVVSDPKILEIPEGGFVVVHDATINRIGYNGELVWQHVADKSKIIKFLGTTITNDNNSLIALGAEYGTGNSTISKISISTGDLVWTKLHDGDFKIRADFLINGHDGLPIILGRSNDNIKGILTLSKIDYEGNEVWTKQHDDNRYNFPFEGQPVKSGGYILVGDSWDSRNLSMGRITKVDNNGELLWDGHYLTDGYDTSLKGIIETKNGDFLAVGSDGDRSQKGLLIKTTPEGELIWKRLFYPDYLDYVWIGLDVVETEDLGIGIVGIKNAVWSNENKEIGPWFIKLDDAGN